MSEFVAYLLKSEKDGRYYIGQTTDLPRRLKMHNNGEVKSTKNRRPLILLGYKTFSTSEDARYFEYQLKHHSDRKRNFIAEVQRPSGREARTP